MRWLAILLAQSLLGPDEGSPYDPPKPPVYKKHDHLRIAVSDRPRAPAPAEGRGRRLPPPPGQSAAPAPLERPAPERIPGAPAFTIAVEIVDIRPNGTLVVQAIQRRKAGQVEEVLKFAGEVASVAVKDRQARLEDVFNLSFSYQGPASPGDPATAGSWSGFLAKVWSH